LYEGWQLQRWETPISDLKSVSMVSLIDDGALSITVEAARESGRPRWCFRFEQVPIYRNILEEYRLELWELQSEKLALFGRTSIIPDSPWLKDFNGTEPLLAECFEGLTHYQISTEDDVIDIISPEKPSITSVAPASASDPIPGKSRIHYSDKDRPQIDALLDDLGREPNA
jgi:hypothetical protein